MKQKSLIEMVVYRESNYQQLTQNKGPTRHTQRHPTKERSTLFTKKHTLGRYEDKNLRIFQEHKRSIS